MDPDQLASVFAETAALRVEAEAFRQAATSDVYDDSQRAALRRSAANMLAAAVATERDALHIDRLPS